MRRAGWKWATVGDVGQYINGMAFKPTDWGTEGRPIIRIQNLTDPSRPFNFTTRSVEQKFKVQDGDILVSWSATLDAFVWRGPEAVLNQHIFKVIPNGDVVSDAFLFYQLKHVIEEMWRGEHTHGSTMMHINRGPFLAHPFWIAPLPEQHRIVAAIETHFSRLDAAVAALTRAKANVKRARASVLKAAVEGRLVPTEAALARAEGRAYESGAALLARILDERRAAWAASGGRGKYKEAVGDGGVGEVPEGWVWASMDSLLNGIEAGRSFSTDSARPTGDQVGIVKVSAVTWGTYDQNESKTVHDPALVNPDYFICRGDLLFSRANTIDLVGAAVIAENVTRPTMLSDKILRLKVPVHLQRWVLWVLRSQHGRRQIESLATGNQESMRNIGQDRIRQISMPLPPLAEQHRIVAEVDRRLSVLDTLDRSLEANLARCGRLRQAILKRAFEGRLVGVGASRGGVGLAEEAGT